MPALSAPRRDLAIAALPAVLLVMTLAPLVLTRLREADVPQPLAALLTMALVSVLAVNIASATFAWLSSRRNATAKPVERTTDLTAAR